MKKILKRLIPFFIIVSIVFLSNRFTADAQDTIKIYGDVLDKQEQIQTDLQEITQENQEIKKDLQRLQTDIEFYFEEIERQESEKKKLRTINRKRKSGEERKWQRFK